MGKGFTLDGKNRLPIIGTIGDDIVQGSEEKPGVFTGTKGIIRLRRGNDTIRSDSRIRLWAGRRFGGTRLGKGRDLITGDSISVNGYREYDRIGLIDGGSLDTGQGADTIAVTGQEEQGLFVGLSSSLGTGKGNDRIYPGAGIGMNEGYVDTGEGDDLINFKDRQGYINAAEIGGLSMGDGDERLLSPMGIGFSFNHSFGAGDDLIDARGGIDTLAPDFNSFIDLGPGDDTLVGCAKYTYSAADYEFLQELPIVVRGGKGKDTIRLPAGEHIIHANQIISNGSTLGVWGFNYLEGINGGRFAYEPGILTVDNQGVATFALGL